MLFRANSIIAASLIVLTISCSGSSSSDSASCASIPPGESLLGGVYNSTIQKGTTFRATFTQSGCDIEGVIEVGTALAGSGPFTGIIEENEIKFTVPAITSDSSFDITFVGEVNELGMGGSYDVGDASQVGTWNLLHITTAAESDLDPRLVTACAVWVAISPDNPCIDTVHFLRQFDAQLKVLVTTLISQTALGDFNSITTGPGALRELAVTVDDLRLDFRQISGPESNTYTARLLLNQIDEILAEIASLYRRQAVAVDNLDRAANSAVMGDWLDVFAKLDTLETTQAAMLLPFGVSEDLIGR